MSADEIVCRDLNAALGDWRGQGFQLESLYPADDPHTAILSRDGAKLRLTTRPGEPPLLDRLPSFQPEFVLTRGGASGQGRAGMRYRDLIPGRLGGRYIASHITIADGGPVADWVHYHAVAWQMIYVHSGWVRVVYEDQGEPFVMHPGDLVLQPPFIRHRVLESSPGLEVIEIGCPAVHKTLSEHDLALPNGVNAGRHFAGQRFLHHVAKRTPWTPYDGGEAQETAMLQATGGLGDVRIVRSTGASPIHFPGHDGELVFGFVLNGSARLEHREGLDLDAGDAFVIPPGEAWSVGDPSSGFMLLHVATGIMPERIPVETA